MQWDPRRDGMWAAVDAGVWLVAAGLLAVAAMVGLVWVVTLVPDLMSFGEEQPTDLQPWLTLMLVPAGIAALLFLVVLALDAVLVVRSIARLSAPEGRIGTAWVTPALCLASVGLSLMALLVLPVSSLLEDLPDIVTQGFGSVAGLVVPVRIGQLVMGVLEARRARA